MSQSGLGSGIWRSVIVRRLAVLGALFALELAAITLCLDNDQIAGRAGLIRVCHDWGPLFLRCTVVFATIFLTFTCLKFPALLAGIAEAAGAGRIHRGALAMHGASLAGFGALSYAIYRLPAISPPFSFATVWPNAAAALWLVSGLSAIAYGAAAFIHPALWMRMVRGTGWLWALALAGALVAGFGGNAMRELWPRATGLTFEIVQVLLKPFGTFAGNAATKTIGSSRFSVEIAPTCSGLEGIGLILVFTAAWLVLFRKECRFPQALLLLPLGAVTLFLLNSVRIAALILIGDAGFESIAVGGFHSQAGWIGFNVVALGISVAARDVEWISKRERCVAVAVNPNAVWVMPFVAVLAAGMLAHAASAGFEWLYPLRFVGALAALWYYRRSYAQIDWRFDWMGPAAGALVFAIWLAMDTPGSSTMPAQLAAASGNVRIAWITVRLLAASVTVPIAEELAFRGYLLRRLISADFEAVSFRSFSWFSIVASSVLFGLLHGERWIAGSVAGALFALAMQRRGRFGNAVIAHATANALIAVSVIVFGRWELW